MRVSMQVMDWKHNLNNMTADAHDLCSVLPTPDMYNELPNLVGLGSIIIYIYIYIYVYVYIYMYREREREIIYIQRTMLFIYISHPLNARCK